MPKYSVTVAVTWEIETDIESKAREKLHDLAASQFESFLFAPVGLGVRWGVRDSKLIHSAEEPSVAILAEYDADEILSIVKPSSKHIVKVGAKIYTVKLNSDRHRLFKANPRCVCCGLLGTKMVLELVKGAVTPHFNLYGVNEYGEYILMTKDHTHPKSRGGKNSLGNYATMCRICNTIKSNACITWEQVKQLRDMLDSNPLMPPKAKSKMLITEREAMEAANRTHRQTELDLARERAEKDFLTRAWTDTELDRVTDSTEEPVLVECLDHPPEATT